MREIFIRYNPYKVETHITIDGKPVKDNSALNIDGRRLQEWIEDLPKILVDECNTQNFKVLFHGTVLDYEDLLSVAKEAEGEGVKINCEHIPAEEIKDKEQVIKKIFHDIQSGPFEELKQSDVKTAFKLATNSDFEVNVVATMSAGKSTLINALLQQKLMPAKQEACTATITKIKDSDFEIFRATAYDNNGGLLQVHPDLSVGIMEKLNSDPNVSNICIEGNIPFVKADDVALVLVDTPGPNNSRDPQHRAATYRMLSESSKTVVLYILNATQLAVNDDNDLLNHVADSMRIGGKQSKDRFIFVVNKLDDFRKGEDSVASALEKVRKYLEDKGINNPNIFPAAALPALDIRSYQLNVDKADEDLEYEIEGKVRKLNRNEDLHLEKYAPLTPSVRGEITNMLVQAKNDNNTYSEALIHTGIIPIEAVIRMYVAKYAKTAKIKNIVDTFAKKLESAKSFENTKQEIASNQDKQNEILSQIDDIKTKLASGQEAKKFKTKIDAINYDKEIRSIADDVIKESQKKISSQIESMDSKQLNCRDAEDICQVFAKFSEGLQAEVQVKLEDIITNHVQNNAQDLLNQYKYKIVDLAKDIHIESVNINPFELIDGEMDNMSDISLIIRGLTKTEKVKIGEEWIKNENKKWFKPSTWFDEKGHYRNIYKNIEFVNGSELAQKFFAPFQLQLFNNSDNAVDYAKEQTNIIKDSFNQKFTELDKILNQKLTELELCATNSKDVELIIKKTQERLIWLENIQARTNAILDI